MAHSCCSDLWSVLKCWDGPHILRASLHVQNWGCDYWACYCDAPDSDPHAFSGHRMAVPVVAAHLP